MEKYRDSNSISSVLPQTSRSQRVRYYLNGLHRLPVVNTPLYGMVTGRRHQHVLWSSGSRVPLITYD